MQPSGNNHRRTRYLLNTHCRARACAEEQQSQHKPKQKPEPLACFSGERLPNRIEAKRVLTGVLRSARGPRKIGRACEGNAEFTPNVVLPCQGVMMSTASTPAKPDHSLNCLGALGGPAKAFTINVSVTSCDYSAKPGQGAPHDGTEKVHMLMGPARCTCPLQRTQTKSQTTHS